MSVYAVVGASGNTGSVVAQALLREGHQVRALVRSPGKAAWLSERGAEVIATDLADARSVAAALQGTAAAYLINPPAETLPDPLRQAMRIADAMALGADKAGVEHLVVLSSIAAHQPAGTGLILTTHLTEQRLRHVGAQTTFLRCAFFLENWLPALSSARETGSLPSELQDIDSPREFVGSTDVGSTAAALLTGEIPFSPLVELAGAQAWTPNEIAAALGRAVGVPLRAAPNPKAAWAAPLRQHGLSEAAIDGFTEMFTAFDSGALAFERTGVNLRGTQSLDHWAQRAVSRLQAADEHFEPASAAA